MSQVSLSSSAENFAVNLELSVELEGQSMSSLNSLALGLKLRASQIACRETLTAFGQGEEPSSSG